jgi:hypothetical protein
MKVALRALSIIPAAIGLFLLFAVIAAITSEEGARVGVCILYVAIAAAMAALVAFMWRKSSQADATTPPPAV